jgi:hypothetical protein
MDLMSMVTLSEYIGIILGLCGFVFGAFFGGFSAFRRAQTRFPSPRPQGDHVESSLCSNVFSSAVAFGVFGCFLGFVAGVFWPMTLLIVLAANLL